MMSYLAVLTHHQLYCTVLYCMMSYLAVLANHQLSHGQHPGALPPQHHELAQVVNLTQVNISINALLFIALVIAAITVIVRLAIHTPGNCTDLMLNQYPVYIMFYVLAVITVIALD